MNGKTKKHVALDPSQTVSATIQLILNHNLAYLTRSEAAARSSSDTEGVHQVRVSFRRMRSALTVFRPALPKRVGANWAEPMRDLAGRLGQARDLDVLIDEVLKGVCGNLPLPGAEGLEKRLRKARGKAYRDVRRMLDSTAYTSFKTAFGDWVEARAWEQARLKKKHRKALAGDVVPFARKVLDRQERRVLEAGAHVDKHDHKAMHRLRIECKKLRYTAEFFAPFFNGMDEFVGHMKGLQDLLGVMNDVAVMPRLLDLALDGESDLDVLRYAGGVVGWRSCYYHALLNDFEPRWEEFVAARHPWWRSEAAVADQAGAADPRTP